jgi:hypothetical protein
MSLSAQCELGRVAVVPSGWYAPPVPRGAKAMYESLLTFLQYAGPVVATVSTIWALTNVVAREEGSRRRLTPAGRVAVGFAVGSLLITLASGYLKSAVDAQQAAAAAEEEARRAAAAAEEEARRAAAAAEKETRTSESVVQALQPLTTLKLTWTFEGIPPAIRAMVADGKNEAKEAYREGVFNVPPSTSNFEVLDGYYALHPFLRAIAEGFPRRNPAQGAAANTILALIGLDLTNNAVLPIGLLLNESLPPEAWRRIQQEELKFAGAVRLPDDKFGFIDNAPPAFSRAMPKSPTLSINGDTATISWDLDAATLRDALDRQADGITLMARLPQMLRVALISEASRLPFFGTNLAAPRECSPWSSDNTAKPVASTAFSSSTITLVPNATAGSTARYRLRSSVLQPLRDDYNHPCKFRNIQMVFETQAA